MENLPRPDAVNLHQRKGKAASREPVHTYTDEEKEGE